MDKFDEKYLQREKKLEEKLSASHKRVEEIKQDIRSRVDLTDEERQDEFIRRYKPLAEEAEKLADEHIATTFNESVALEEKVHAGAGSQFSQHLTALSSAPDEKLPELMDTATRTGQRDLAQAVAEVALTRNKFGIFEKWAEANPEKGEALKRLRSLPDHDRLMARTNARTSVPKADMASLTPTREDEERVRELAARKAAPRQEFFNLPRQQVGRRIS